MSYAFNSVVSKQEQDALKNMIFKRAQERAQLLVDEVQSSYTTSTQTEIMDLARNSFVANKNPFSLESAKKESVVEDTSDEMEKIELSKKHAEEIKNKIYEKQESIKSDMARNLMNANMDEARNALDKKHSFMGALEFLNSQASISLVKNKGKSFEALA